MAHPEQLEFVQLVQSAFPEHFRGRRVLEIGSLDINGSVRTFFSDCDYLGLDVAPGRGVDLVCQGQAFDGPEGSFDVVISCEAMEHNPHWKGTMENMIRLVRPGGLVIMSCATLGRPEHGTSRCEPTSSPLTVQQGWDYYRNLVPGDLRRVRNLDALATWGAACNWSSFDLYFLGIKSPASPESAGRLRGIFSIYRKRFWSSLKWIRRALRKRLKHTLLGRR